MIRIAAVQFAPEFGIPEFNLDRDVGSAGAVHDSRQLTATPQSFRGAIRVALVDLNLDSLHRYLNS